ncbi:MAG: type II toxin-antitoxin system RelE/ParE family toxin [bacterium]|nr:type II toxin-antitoxin system RelE/ParE family toxin [bacterium]
MKVRSVRHRGLHQLLNNDNPKYLPYDLTDRVRKVLTALVLANNMDDFVASAPRGWRVHRLSGDRSQHWSVSVSSNWRITFEEEAGHINRLNLEDYH